MLINSFALLISCCESNCQCNDLILTVHKRQIIEINSYTCSLYKGKNKKLNASVMFSKHLKKKKETKSFCIRDLRTVQRNFLFLFFLRIFKDTFLNAKDELNICKHGFLDNYFRKKFLTRQHIFFVVATNRATFIYLFAQCANRIYSRTNHDSMRKQQVLTNPP